MMNPMSCRTLPSFAALAAVALGLGAATPASAMTEYLGGGYLYPANDGCSAHGWTGTHQVLARMQPQGAAGNPRNETQLALLLGTGTIAVRMNLDHGIRWSYAPTQATYVWNGPWSPEDPTMRFLFSPDADFPIGNDQEYTRIVARVENFNEHEGCTMWMYLLLRRN